MAVARLGRGEPLALGRSKEPRHRPQRRRPGESRPDRHRAGRAADHTGAQKKYGIVDSPDLYFQDLTDWSVVEPNGSSNYTFNDRELMRAAADNSAPLSTGLAADK